MLGLALAAWLQACVDVTPIVSSDAGGDAGDRVDAGADAGTGTSDAGADAGNALDAGDDAGSGTPDAGSDAGPPDAGLPDAGADGGVADAGIDGGLPDAGFDGGRPDAGTDGGLPDAGLDGGRADAGVDGGSSDAGTDGGSFDAGATDAGADGGLADAGSFARCPTAPRADAGTAPCYAGPVTTLVFTDLTLFSMALQGVTTVDFDCIDTTADAGAVAFPRDLFAPAFGVVITAASDGGQYVHPHFGYPTQYQPVSAPNLYAPGPVVDVLGAAGTPATDVTFLAAGAPGCVAGFGASFVDADFPSISPSTISAYGAQDTLLHTAAAPLTVNAGASFVGLLTVDDGGIPVPGLSRARVVNGNVWPGQVCCEGVALDDFVFGR